MSNCSSSKPAKISFTQEDEINILNSVLNTREIPILGGHFSKAQIVNKIRKLKQKYQKQSNSKSSLKTDHDVNTYEISREIWGPKTPAAAAPVPMKNEQIKIRVSEGKCENTVDLSDFPYLMRQVSKDFPNNVIYKQGLMGLGEDILKGLDKKWMELEMDEAALESRRAEMVYNKLKSAMLQGRK